MNLHICPSRHPIMEEMRNPGLFSSEVLWMGHFVSGERADTFYGAYMSICNEGGSILPHNKGMSQAQICPLDEIQRIRWTRRYE